MLKEEARVRTNMMFGAFEQNRFDTKALLYRLLYAYRFVCVFVYAEENFVVFTMSVLTTTCCHSDKKEKLANRNKKNTKYY